MSKKRYEDLLSASPYSYACPLKKITEDDFDSILGSVGGVRIAEADDKTADYKIDNFVLELKFLEKEGTHSLARQNKLASLFKPTQPDRPVVVLDERLLDDTDMHLYRQIHKGTIQSHVRKAKRQLENTRLKHSDTNCSILFIHNIGFASMSQEDLFKLIKNRVRNDTSSIDGVIVSGSFAVSDGFNVEAIMRFDYEPISDIGKAIKPKISEIHSAFFASQMLGLNSAMRSEIEPTNEATPRTDIVFDLDGIRYVRPAPLLSADASMFPQGRPRISVEPGMSGTDGKRPKIVPKLIRSQWSQLSEEGMVLDGDSYEEWITIEKSRLNDSVPLALVAAEPVDLDKFKKWCEKEKRSPVLQDSLNQFAVYTFNQTVEKIILGRNEFVLDGVRPRRYVLVCTEIIGQDESNDISHIFVADEQGDEYPFLSEIVSDIRVCQDEAICIAAVNAVSLGLDAVYWYENRNYAWV